MARKTSLANDASKWVSMIEKLLLLSLTLSQILHKLSFQHFQQDSQETQDSFRRRGQGFTGEQKRKSVHIVGPRLGLILLTTLRRCIINTSGNQIIEEGEKELEGKIVKVYLLP